MTLTTIRELSRTIVPFWSTTSVPVISFVTPIASLGRSKLTSCSRTRYLASLPVGAMMYRSRAGVPDVRGAGFEFCDGCASAADAANEATKAAAKVR